MGRMSGWELRDLRGVFGCREFEGGRNLQMKSLHANRMIEKPTYDRAARKARWLS